MGRLMDTNYYSVHKWLFYKFGKAGRCEGENCTGKSKKFEWSLIHGKKYERKRENFRTLCKSCHTRYDESLKTHCPKGHEFTDANTRIDKRGHRSCRICNNNASKRYYKNKIRGGAVIKKYKPRLKENNNKT